MRSAWGPAWGPASCKIVGMRVLLLGATGMVGQGVLRECLLDDRVTSVVTISRTPVAQLSPKLEQVLLADLAEVGSSTPAIEALAGVDAVFYALGVSSVGMDEQAYAAVTYDLAMALGQAIRTHAGQDVRFIYVSGSGTDATEGGRTMWARVKGRTENDLRAMFPQAVMFRPGAIQPMHGERTKSVWIDRVYAASRPLMPILRRIAGSSINDTESIGRAMIAVATGDLPPALDDLAIFTPSDITLAAGSPAQ